MASGGETVRVVSGGDVKFGSPLSTLPASSDDAVQAAFAYGREADLCFMNCEMPLTTRGHRVEKTINLRSDPAVARDLADTLGAHVVTLANNHMLDYGHEGLADTLATIDAAGIARVGAGNDLDAALRPHLITVNGVRFACFGVAATLPPGFAAGVDRPGVAPIRVDFSFVMDSNLMMEQPGTAPFVHTTAQPQDVECVTDAIALAKRDADHVLVAVHWGTTTRRVTPIQGMIAEYQEPLGHAFVDAGADVVFGNHSHNLHGVEVYRGKPIFYSLGNFIFTDPSGPYHEPESVIVLADFSQSGLRVQLVPVLANEGGFPQVVYGAARDDVLRLLEARSGRFGTRFAPTSDGVEVDLKGCES